MSHVVDTYELSPMQAGMLFHALSGGDAGVDIQQVVARLHETLDETRFLRAWRRVVERHPILRSRFRWEGMPVQDVLVRVHIPVERLDWRALAQAEREERFQALLDEDRNRGFDLHAAPLMRLALVRAADSEYWLLWTFHHALLDGRSFPLVLREAFAFYEAFSRGEYPNLPLPRPYRDYVEWLRTLDHSAAKRYWQGVLSGFGAPTPLGVGRDRPTEQVTGKLSGTHEARLSSALTGVLRQRAREASVTLNTLLQGAWALLLHRYSGEQDIVFGATRACRRSTLAGVENMVGLLINTLPMRVGVDPEARLVPWLQQLRAQQVALRAYEHAPLVDVQAWSETPRGTPLFESLLVYESQALDAQLRALGGAWNARRFEYRGQTNFPLTVAAYGDEALLLRLEYSRRRFGDDFAARMLDHLRTLLEGMAAHPQARLKDLPLLTQAERQRLLVEWNDTQTDYPADALVHQLYEAQAARTPDAPALLFGGRSLTYRELDARANRLAQHLRSLGVGPDVLVGLCVERSPEMVVGLLGILKAGGAYVPLDPSYPAQRLAFMLEDAQAPVFLTQARLLSRLAGHGAAAVCLDSDWHKFEHLRPSPPPSLTRATDLAYVIYTSGSTGKPKGACITHRNLVNYLTWAASAYKVAEGTGAPVHSSVAFDLTVTSLFTPLLAGRPVDLLPGDEDLEALAGALRTASGYSLVKLTPAHLQLLELELALAPGEVAGRTRAFVIGGEQLYAEALAFWRKHAPDTVLVNEYGPTETTVGCAAYTVSPETRSGGAIPIGRPIANTRLYVLDRYMQPVPIGVLGELYIGGDGVARGYWNRPQLTAERFVPDPFSATTGGRLYRTGDLARYLPDGNIEFVGRIDEQVKLRGFRIELGEIEAGIARHPAIRESAVVAREDAPGDKRLVAYLVTEEPRDDLGHEVRALLRTVLPEYMVPAHFVSLGALPLTENGKLDRKALPAPSLSSEAPPASMAPRTPTEDLVIAEFRAVLEREDFGVLDNFFDLGGHSLKAVRLMSRLRAASGLDVPLRNLFERPTVAGLAEAIDGLSWSGKSKTSANGTGDREEIEL